MEKVIVRSHVYQKFQNIVPELCYYGPRRLTDIIASMYKNSKKEYTKTKVKAFCLHRTSGTPLILEGEIKDNTIFITGVKGDPQSEKVQRKTVNPTKVLRGF